MRLIYRGSSLGEGDRKMVDTHERSRGDLMRCPLCEKPMSRGLFDWHFVCASCDYESSTLVGTISDDSTFDSIDAAKREKCLEALRKDNFNRLLDELTKTPTRKVLEVGCAHGWFLELAAERGLDAVGIEPERMIAEAAIAKGLNVIHGFFPQDVEADAIYDAIVFNDVFEHIPNAGTVLDNCREMLADGVLLINIPSSRGLIYRASRVLARVGFGSYFERLWQVGLPSPHVHYFSLSSLTALLDHHGFDVIASGVLPTIKLEGLKERIFMSSRYPFALNVAACVAAYAAYPLMARSGDIMYVMARRASQRRL